MCEEEAKLNSHTISCVNALSDCWRGLMIVVRVRKNSDEAIIIIIIVGRRKKLYMFFFCIKLSHSQRVSHTSHNIRQSNEKTLIKTHSTFAILKHSPFAYKNTLDDVRWWCETPHIRTLFPRCVFFLYFCSYFYIWIRHLAGQKEIRGFLNFTHRE